MELAKKYIRRFWSKVSIGEPDECWLWKCGQYGKGYGCFTFLLDGQKHNEGSHRVSYWLSRGDHPGELFVCHHCDVRACCNPSHLFLGTHDDNMADMAKKGRSGGQSGEANPFAKLRETDVRTIHSLVAADVPLVEIAKAFGVTAALISQIKRKRAWTCLSLPDLPQVRRNKLDADQVSEIKRRLAAGESQNRISRDYSVTQPAISAISRGLTWRHVEA